MSVEASDSDVFEEKKEIQEESSDSSESDEGTESEAPVSQSLIRQSPLSKRSKARSSSTQSTQSSRGGNRSRSRTKTSHSTKSAKSRSRHRKARSRSRSPRRSRSNRSSHRSRSRSYRRQRSPTRRSRSDSPRSSQSQKNEKEKKVIKKTKHKKPPSRRIKESEYDKKYLNWTWILTGNGEIWLYPEDDVHIGKSDDVYLLSRVFGQHSRREGREKKDNIGCLVFWNNDKYYLIQPDRYYAEHPHAIKELGEKLTAPTSEVTLSEKKSKFASLSSSNICLIEFVNSIFKPILAENLRRASKGMSIALFQYLYICEYL